MTESVNNVISVVAINTELTVDIQYALEESNLSDSDAEEPPSPETLSQWAQSAYSSLENSIKNHAEVTIRIVAEAEMRHLNNQYRGKDKTTNVLSFPFENEFSSIAELAPGLLGDIVICHSVIVAEAIAQTKTVKNHYAHMVTHGILHLCGYDHQQDQQAEQMEALEVKILAQSNIPNPYTANSELD